MDEKIIDSIKFAINEKADMASKLMNLYRGTDSAKFEFYRGQYLAYCEMYSMLTNVSN
jgi:hypothetical protein